MARSDDGSNRDARMGVIGAIYRLHGALRSNFAGPNSSTGLILLEALVLGVVVINKEPPTVSDIGRVLGFSRQSVQRVVNKLLDMELLTAAPNPRHKKAPLFVATDSGRARMESVQAKSRVLADQLIDPFDDARAERLLAELDALLTAIQAHSDPDDDG